MSKSPDTSSNTDTSTEYPKSDLFDHHISFISQNVQSLRSDSQSINLDAIIEVMKKNNISIYCIQETWLDSDFVKEINGYIMFHYGLKNKFVVEDKKELRLFSLRSSIITTNFQVLNL